MTFSVSYLRNNPQTGGFHPAMWAVRIGLIITGLASFYSLARLTVPQIASLAAAALPKLSTAAKAWLAPPYLFITVHLIILVIWKLSDHKHHHHSHSISSFNSTTAASTASIYDGNSSSNVVTAATSDLVKSLTPEISPASDESCVTTESDDDSAISASRHRHVIKKSLNVNTVVQESSVISVEAEVAAHVYKAEEEQEDDSMDATWKAILERASRPSSAAPSPLPVRVRPVRDESAGSIERGSRPSSAAPSPLPVRVRPVREESAGTDEMNRRFEDFIKKSHNQIRLQMETTKNREVY